MPHSCTLLVAFLVCSVFIHYGTSNPSVGPHMLDVTCNEKSIEIVLIQTGNVGLKAKDLRLADSSCTLYSNGSHLLANTTLDDCGTEMTDDGVNLIFSNAVVSFNDTNSTIVRAPSVDIEFSCKYPKWGNVTLQFTGHRPPVNFTQRGFGTFTLQFEFFESSGFGQKKDPNSYPLEFSLGEMMYMQIESFSAVPNTELFAESCTATPTDSPTEAITYPIINSGCKVDETVVVYANGNESKVQFAMKAFKFIGEHDQVFIRCSVVLCKAGVANSRCTKGCSSGLAKREAPDTPFGDDTSNSVHSIHKREAPYQTANHFISQGPVRLRRSVAKQDITEVRTVAPSVEPNLVIAFGSLLAAVAMVCGAVVYRTWKIKIPYARMV